MQNNQHDCSTINDLIKVTIDSVDGYRKAAEDAEARTYQSLFLDRAAERETVVERLQAFVRVRGQEPETSGSVAAGAHRMFVGLRDAIMGNDDKAIVEEVERGEDHIKAKYQDAYRDPDLSIEARNLIEENQRSIMAGHDQMSALKHQLQQREDHGANIPM